MMMMKRIGNNDSTGKTNIGVAKTISNNYCYDGDYDDALIMMRMEITMIQQAKQIFELQKLFSIP